MTTSASTTHQAPVSRVPNGTHRNHVSTPSTSSSRQADTDAPATHRIRQTSSPKTTQHAQPEPRLHREDRAERGRHALAALTLAGTATRCGRARRRARRTGRSRCRGSCWASEHRDAALEDVEHADDDTPAGARAPGRRWWHRGCPSPACRRSLPRIVARIVAGLTAPMRKAATDASTDLETTLPRRHGHAHTAVTAPAGATRRRRWSRARRGRRRRHRARRPRTSPPSGQPVATLAQPPGEVVGAATASRGGARRCRPAARRPPRRGRHGQLLEPGQRARRGAHLLQRADVPVDEPEDRLDRQGRPEERRRRPDPPTAPQVLERVDVEHHRRRLGARTRLCRNVFQRRHRCSASSAADSTAYPIAMPSERESTTVTGTGDCCAARCADSTVEDMSAEMCTDTMPSAPPAAAFS